MSHGREVKVAVLGDLHYDGKGESQLRDLFVRMSSEADIIAMVGDLTTHGEPEQVRGLVDALGGIDRPMVTVLGNHDHESGHADEVCQILGERGIHVLDGENVTISGVGFAGVKGFGGGFGRRALGAFGEKLYKDFVQAAIDEALKLETALRTLRAEVRIALLHYSRNARG